MCSNAENLSKIDRAVNELETTQNLWEKKRIIIIIIIIIIAITIGSSDLKSDDPN